MCYQTPNFTWKRNLKLIQNHANIAEMVFSLLLGRKQRWLTIWPQICFLPKHENAHANGHRDTEREEGFSEVCLHGKHPGTRVASSSSVLDGLLPKPEAG